MSWCRWSESKRNLRFSQNPVPDYYHSTTRGAQPHNCRTPIESGFFKCVSMTRHYASNTNQVLTNYSSTNRLLALSLALQLSRAAHDLQKRYVTHAEK